MTDQFIDPTPELGDRWGVYHPRTAAERAKLGPSALIIDGRPVKGIAAHDVERYREIAAANELRRIARERDVMAEIRARHRDPRTSTARPAQGISRTL